jgi:hypothetical protein
MHISDDSDEHARIHAEWDRFHFDIPLEIIDSPYRELVEPVERHLDALEARYASDRVTVLIPEFVMGVKKLSNLLHGQSGLALKLALLERPNTVVTSVPFHVRDDKEPGSRRVTPLHELDRQRLAQRFKAVTDHDQHRQMSAVPLRERVNITGEVTGIRVVPRAGSPSLEVTLNDGSGSVLLVFTGRRRIAGIDPGRALDVEGVAREEHGRVILLNPRYTLLTHVG